ncbi:RNA polymerase [Salmonella phage FSL SP-058]|uniref:DNA-directed RNA polymerase n=1 Tax=Salmonella phage FSL SP-058 TaxID=1173761 RepID=S4TTK6_9CAUD|nr:RNA polymerase [Salmonella phage FSL SP-058]AGF88137.1 RNA polymerase subunit [Salmonella phage FSL SP-058]
MQTFSAFQYIKLDVANSFGLDKETFDTRLNWFNENKGSLSGLVDDADEPAQFYAGMLAYQDVLEGKPIGYMVGMDATASGLQCMAALTGCKVTAETVNLVDPNVRKDAYTDGYKVMGNLLEGKIDKVDRKDVKGAIMTHFYGSQANPKSVFGENTIELQKFYEMVQIIAPGANMLRDDLINLWQPKALQHMWELPDGFTAVVKVMTMKEASFEVNELDSSFTHRYWVNEGQDFGLSLAANTIHSVDGMVVREMNRRANYDAVKVQRVYELLTGLNTKGIVNYTTDDSKLQRALELAEKHKFVSAVLIEFIDHKNIHMVPLWIKNQLIEIIEKMLAHKPYPIVAIHDCFKCHPLYMNNVRQNYIDIFAQIADSTMLQAIASQISGKRIPVAKLSNNLSTLIRQSNYMLS